MLQMLKSALIASLFATATFHASAAEQSPSELVDAARQALGAGQYDQAIDLYGKAREALPQLAEIPYNMAVAQYRKGDYQKAGELFKEVVSLTNDPKLRAFSSYNMGNAAYAQSLQSMEQPQQQENASDPAAQLNAATENLKQAIESFKHAIDADPADEDAKANAEMSHRLLKQLKEMQQNMQQQSSQQQQQDQQQNQDQQQQPQNQQQQQHSQNPDQQRPQSQSNQQQQQQAEQSDPSKPQDDQQNQPQLQSSEENQNTPNEVQAEQTAATQPDNQGDHVQHNAGKQRTMKREEAERLLQAVRDKERKRRAEIARREAARYAPAEKDW